MDGGTATVAGALVGELMVNGGVSFPLEE
jgi:hypothetical protein